MRVLAKYDIAYAMTYSHITIKVASLQKKQAGTVSVSIIIIWTHTFPMITMANSASRFTKLHSSTWQNYVTHSAAVTQIKYIPKRNFSYWRLALCQNMLTTYTEHQQFCLLKSKIGKVALYLLVYVHQWQNTNIIRYQLSLQISLISSSSSRSNSSSRLTTVKYVYTEHC